MFLRSMFVSVAVFLANTAVVADQVVFEDGQNQIILETATRDYLVRYIGDDGTLKTIRWTPPTNIDASVRSRFELIEDDMIRFSYAIENRKSSPQPIVDAKILTSKVDKKAVTVPNTWKNFIVENPKEGSTGYWIIWSQNRIGIPAGKNQAGYAVVKEDLPGIGHMWLSGAATTISFSDEGPRGKMVEYLEGDFFFAHKDGIPRLSAVPKIANPFPFNATIVLAGIQKHLREDLVPMKLVEPVFAERFNSLLDAAIDAARRNNIAGLRAHLKDLRLMLKGFGEPGEDSHAADIPEDQVNTKLWPHPVAKLAARVLDFDLSYVEKRI